MRHYRNFFDHKEPWLLYLERCEDKFIHKQGGFQVANFVNSYRPSHGLPVRLGRVIARENHIKNL